MKAKKSADRQPPVTPLHGLLVLALIGLLAGLAGSAAQHITSAEETRELRTGGCVYVVYRDGKCLGSVFLQQAASLPDIIGALEHAPHAVPTTPDEIPCGSAVHLSNDMRLVSHESLSGDQILCTGLRIDVNTAGASDLLPVPGIGPQLAQRIVQHRNASGGFRTLEELREVPGIGRGKLSRMAPFLTTGNAENRLPALARPAPPSSP